MKTQKVKMVNTTGKKPKMNYTQEIIKFSALGKEIKISPKSHICINKAGYKAEYFVETISINIGIGKDHTAELIMPIDAYNALHNGENVFVTTLKEFNDKYVKRSKSK